ncbi:unnamed protein product [Boreogadus saida]
MALTYWRPAPSVSYISITEEPSSLKCLWMRAIADPSSYQAENGEHLRLTAAPPSQVSHKLRGACVLFLFFPRPVASPWVVLRLGYFSVRVHWPWRPRACEYISPAVTVGDRCKQREEDGQVAAQASAITAG